MPDDTVPSDGQKRLNQLIFRLDSDGQKEACMCYMGSSTLVHLENATEPSVCGGDAALYQMTLTTCHYSGCDL